jgi:hypothetical protein
MNPAYAADHADRLHARLLHQALRPPRNRMSRPAQAAHSGKQKVNDGRIDHPDAAAQRACAAALRHADRLGRTAATLAAVGQRDAARRLARLADDLCGIAR